MATAAVDSGRVHPARKSSPPDVHERTPLLGSDPIKASPLTSEDSPLLAGPAVDASPLLDAQRAYAVSPSAEEGRELKTVVGVASVLPVLLIGASAPRS
jgi:hypothetical protein